MSTEMTPEEIRHKMRERFDALNDAEEDRHQTRRTFNQAQLDERNKPAAGNDTEGPDETGQNDSAGS